jgi:hypothetical protein
VVLVARGGGQTAELDVFEDERVVSALSSLTDRCPTILAVGHAGDELLTNKVVTYPMEAASGAVQLIVRESRERPRSEASGGQAEEGVEVEERASVPPPSRRRSGGPNALGVLVGVVLLSAAAYLGWWARGILEPGDEARPHARAASVAD